MIQLNYQVETNALLFKCDWVAYQSENRRVKKDKFNVMLANLKRMRNDDPFVLAFQVEQVSCI